jgi:hypothetical protein
LHVFAALALVLSLPELGHAHEVEVIKLGVGNIFAQPIEFGVFDDDKWKSDAAARRILATLGRYKDAVESGLRVDQALARSITRGKGLLPPTPDGEVEERFVKPLRATELGALEPDLPGDGLTAFNRLVFRALPRFLASRGVLFVPRFGFVKRSLPGSRDYDVVTAFGLWRVQKVRREDVLTWGKNKFETVGVGILEIGEAVPVPGVSFNGRPAFLGDPVERPDRVEAIYGNVVLDRSDVEAWISGVIGFSERDARVTKNLIIEWESQREAPGRGLGPLMDPVELSAFNLFSQDWVALRAVGHIAAWYTDQLVTRGAFHLFRQRERSDLPPALPTTLNALQQQIDAEQRMHFTEQYAVALRFLDARYKRLTLWSLARGATGAFANAPARDGALILLDFMLGYIDEHRGRFPAIKIKDDPVFTTRAQIAGQLYRLTAGDLEVVMDAWHRSWPLNPVSAVVVPPSLQDLYVQRDKTWLAALARPILGGFAVLAVGALGIVLYRNSLMWRTVRRRNQRALRFLRGELEARLGDGTQHTLARRGAQTLWEAGVKEASAITGLSRAQLASLRGAAEREARRADRRRRGVATGAAADAPRRSPVPGQRTSTPPGPPPSSFSAPLAPNVAIETRPSELMTSVRGSRQRRMEEYRARSDGAPETADAAPPREVAAQSDSTTPQQDVDDAPANALTPEPWQIVPPWWEGSGYVLEVLVPFAHGFERHANQRAPLLRALEKIKNRLDGEDDITLFSPAALRGPAIGLYEERIRNFRLVYAFVRTSQGVTVTLADFFVKGDIVRAEGSNVDHRYIRDLVAKVESKHANLIRSQGRIRALEATLFRSTTGERASA